MPALRRGIHLSFCQSVLMFARLLVPRPPAAVPALDPPHGPTFDTDSRRCRGLLRGVQRFKSGSLQKVPGKYEMQKENVFDLSDITSVCCFLYTIQNEGYITFFVEKNR